MVPKKLISCSGKSFSVAYSQYEVARCTICSHNSLIVRHHKVSRVIGTNRVVMRHHVRLCFAHRIWFQVRLILHWIRLFFYGRLCCISASVIYLFAPVFGWPSLRVFSGLRIITFSSLSVIFYTFSCRWQHLSNILIHFYVWVWTYNQFLADYIQIRYMCVFCLTLRTNMDWWQSDCAIVHNRSDDCGDVTLL